MVAIREETAADYEVIGVVDNQKYMDIREVQPKILFTASAQLPDPPSLTRRYVIRAATPATQTIAAISSTVAAETTVTLTAIAGVVTITTGSSVRSRNQSVLLQAGDDRGRRVEPDGVADPAPLRRVGRQDDGDQTCASEGLMHPRSTVRDDHKKFNLRKAAVS